MNHISTFAAQTTLRDGAGAPARANTAPRERDDQDATRSRMEWVVSRAVRARMLTLADQNVLVCIIRGARRCRTGALVNALDAAVLATHINRHPTTVSRAVLKLEAGGWLINRSRSNGARGCDNGILFGLDVLPILERGDDVEREIERRDRTNAELRDGRARLKRAKGELRRMTYRACRESAAIAAQAAELLVAIPRRFGELTADMLHAWINEIQKLLVVERGDAKTHHRPNASDEPTDTTKESSICRRPAGENDADNGRKREERPSGREANAEFDIDLRQALMLLPEKLRQDVLQDYATDPSALWQGLWEMGRSRWQEVGGEDRALHQVVQSLGMQQAAVLVLLVTAQARSGKVRNVQRYLGGCLRRGLDGAFMWGAGVRSAMTLVQGECST